MEVLPRRLQSAGAVAHCSVTNPSWPSTRLQWAKPSPATPSNRTMNSRLLDIAVKKQLCFWTQTCCCEGAHLAIVCLKAALNHLCFPPARSLPREPKKTSLIAECSSKSTRALLQEERQQKRQWLWLKVPRRHLPSTIQPPWAFRNLNCYSMGEDLLKATLFPQCSSQPHPNYPKPPPSTTTTQISKLAPSLPATEVRQAIKSCTKSNNRSALIIPQMARIRQIIINR